LLVLVQWTQRDASGAVLRRLERRVDVEEALESEHAAKGDAWLGQFVGGVWEIRARALPGALEHVLSGLAKTGAVSMLLPAQSGRAHTLYCAANRYFAGEAFPRASSGRRRRVGGRAGGGGEGEGEEEEEEEAEEEEQLADIELERLRNIERVSLAAAPTLWWLLGWLPLCRALPCYM
jgi:hypothetical protein